MNEKSEEEATEYLLVLADTGLAGMGRRDVNRQEHNEDAAKLREKVISDSLKGVIPDISDPEDSYKGKSGAVGDILDSGHGYKVESRPEGKKQPRQTCERCGSQLLFQIGKCLGFVLPWLPRGKSRMVGTPETDGSPLPWWSADRLLCQCRNCKNLSNYVRNDNQVSSSRKFCSDTCRKANHKAQAAAKRQAAKQDQVLSRWAGFVPVEDRDPDYHYSSMGVKGRKKLRSGSWGTDCTNGTIHPNYE